MLRFLALVLAVTAVCAEEAKTAEPVKVDPEPNVAESAIPVVVDYDDYRRGFQDGLQLNRHREERMNLNRMRDSRNDRDDHDHQRGQNYNQQRGHRHDDDHEIRGPVILRTINPHSHRHPDIERQNRIIADVYSPDYYQPTWILDYRYLKTGGRDYTRGPGGQILILPKNVRSNEPNEYPDFDSLLEHHRLSRISERAQQRREHGHNHAFQGYSTLYHGQQNRLNPYRQ